MQFHADMEVMWSSDTTACETSLPICAVVLACLYELKLVEVSWVLTIILGQLMCLLMDGIGLSQMLDCVNVLTDEMNSAKSTYGLSSSEGH